ncbi:MAG: hypothetical protein ACLQGP_10915 [Isosphaeraceae bacterium]
MTNDQYQLIDQIRAALHSGDHGSNGRLAGLASAYASACQEATQRLGRCHRLLQQGLRSEAIQLAESEPKLLDTLAALDFPERAEWDNLVQMHDLPVAPRLPIEPARLLNEAYAEEDPLQDLLRRHRRLALQRAPLRLRIGVLSQLAAQDPGNPVWADDLRAFEAVRLLQIQEEASQAGRHHDSEAIGRLLAEVEQPGWSEPPPRSLLQSLRKADAQLRGERGRAALDQIADRLEAAFNATDPIRGDLARQEWARLATALQVPHDDPIADRVRPALDWLDDEARRSREGRDYEECVTALNRALDFPGTVPAVELEQLAHAVSSHGHGLPEGLQQRYITRLHAAESAQSRRFRLIVAASAATILLVGTLIYSAIHGQARANEADRAATAIDDMLELGEFDHALALLKKLESTDPSLMTYPRMVEVRERIEIAQGKESDRALQFDKAMREAESAPLSSKPPPSLETARSLARLESEKAAIETLVRRRDADLLAEQSRREKSLNPRLDEVARAVARVEQLAEAAGPTPSDEAAVFSPLADTQRQLTELGPDLDLAGEEAQGRARGLTKRLDAIRERLDRRHLQSQLEDAITATVAYSPDSRGFNSPTEFANALQTFARSFPDLPRSQAFNETLKDQSLWTAIGAWDRLSSGWSNGQGGIAPQEAKVRAEQCKQFLVQHPGSPDADRATAYQRAMEAVAHRSADGEGALGKLQQLLTDLLVDNLWMVDVKPPFVEPARHYYLTQKPPPDAKSFKYLAGFNGEERNAKIVPDWIEKSDVAPQTKVAARFKLMLFQDPGRIDWETVMIDLIEAIKTQPEMDPVLQIALLRKVVESAVEGSEPLRTALAAFKTRAEQADVDVNVPWMDPDSREADRMRPRASGFVRSLPDIAHARKEAIALRARVDRQITQRPQPVGWLAREPAGWRIRTGSVLPEAGTLWVVMPGDGTHGAWKKIGSLTLAKPQLSVSDDPALAEGRPVFVTLAGAE